MNSPRAVFAVWLNASQRSPFGAVMNRSAKDTSVKRFERSDGLDTANITLPLL